MPLVRYPAQHPGVCSVRIRPCGDSLYGFERSQATSAAQSVPLKQGFDLSWLDVCDFLYSGDPRPTTCRVPTCAALSISTRTIRSGDRQTESL
jgi:hypothetical protein